MSFDPIHFQELTNRYLIGKLTPAEFSELETALRHDPEARRIYRQACRLDTQLRAKAQELETLKRRAIKRRNLILIPTAVAALAMIFGGVILFGNRGGARIAEVSNAVWNENNFAPGDTLKTGTKLDIESGSALIAFDSGATTLLTGPARFQIKSGNSGFLAFGAADSVAATPDSHGFAIKMPVATAVDIGTAFRTRVNRKTDSHVSVTQGEAGVDVGGKQHSLLEGMALEVKAGNPSVIVRIEEGDLTPAFKFPTIAAPSATDYADASQAMASVTIKGRLGLSSQNDADPATLNDGKGQTNGTSPREAFYFKGDEIGSIIFDLGSKVSLSKVNTYSWHEPGNEATLNAAFQSYTLWAYHGDEMPPVSDNPRIDGWKYITEINSDDYFEIADQKDRPRQQACSIEGANGNIGKYRFLFFDVKSSHFRNHDSIRAYDGAHTRFGEIDIYVDEN
ncbi:MAG: FecR domain-containing protein [Verrucomicrobiales bacterium]|nr:FecR domain-containing protein [Verrucomicrobiales bacterium]